MIGSLGWKEIGDNRKENKENTGNDLKGRKRN